MLQLGVPLNEHLDQHPVSRLDARWRRPEVLEAIFDQLSDALFLFKSESRRFLPWRVGFSPKAQDWLAPWGFR
jgi:hypothetical protein